MVHCSRSLLVVSLFLKPIRRERLTTYGYARTSAAEQIAGFATLATLSRRSDTAAILYALKLWPALTCYAEDSCIENDKTAAERALRGVALGRRNFLFAGAPTAGTNARLPCTGSSERPG